VVGGPPGEPRRALEHLDHHRLRQPAGEGVLLAGVEAADQSVAPDLRLGGMTERRPRPDGLPHTRQRLQHALPGDGAQADDDPQPFERGEFGEPGMAGSWRAPRG
jgi:hypothetical protein